MSQQDNGLYHKFNVSRVDGSDAPGEKHHGCQHFVLDLTHDRHAIPAAAAYAESCAVDYPQLAADLRTSINKVLETQREFVTVPETKLPNGLVVPAFQVGKYLCGRAAGDSLVVNETAAPWVEICYHDARELLSGAGLALLTETQALAIAHNIASQDINWSGGRVGDGVVFQGLHMGTVDEAQPATYMSPNEAERRWHQLSNGEKIFDFAGNAYTWIFDDIQGDERGLVAKQIQAASPSLAAPYPSMEKGMGWRPESNANWSGVALVRGGCWFSGDDAGVFRLSVGWPGGGNDDVGVRCTKGL